MAKEVERRKQEERRPPPIPDPKQSAYEAGMDLARRLGLGKQGQTTEYIHVEEDDSLEAVTYRNEY